MELAFDDILHLEPFPNSHVIDGYVHSHHVSNHAIVLIFFERQEKGAQMSLAKR